MRILYSFGYFLDDAGGHVIHGLKLGEALQNAGHELRFIAPLSKSIRTQQPLALPAWTYPINSWKNGIDLAFRFRKAIKEQALSWKPDIIYIRPTLKDVQAIQWIAQSGIPYFMEINTLLFHEFFQSGNIPKAYLLNYIEKMEARRSTGILCITKEIEDAIRAKIPADIPSCVTGNGFDPEEVLLTNFDPAARLELKTPVDAKVIIFTGSLQSWQGVDRLLTAVEKIEDVYFWVIGGGDEQAILHKLAKQYHISARVRWIDWISNQQLNRYIKASDFAAGPLALDRKRMKEAQPMKVRSYLGAGLPLLYGYYDTKIHDGLPWAQKVDATSIDAITQGIKTLMLLPTRSTELRQEIRDYAVRNLSWNTIASETLEFIQDCLNIRNSHIIVPGEIPSR